MLIAPYVRIPNRLDIRLTFHISFTAASALIWQGNPEARFTYTMPTNSAEMDDFLFNLSAPGAVRIGVAVGAVVKG